MMSLALEAVMAGGDQLRRKFGGRLEILHKGEVDLVTDADRAAEAAIVAVIRERYREHAILAEEADYGNDGESDWRWIIDPLDGTTNFAHGFPWFAVSLALEKAGQVLLGIVYNPIFEELYVAERGRGATLNGKPLQVSPTRELDQALLATGFPYDRKQSPANNYDHFVNFQQVAQACRRPGAASLDLACTAAGRFDGYWEMKLKPWDMAAGLLLVTEAGGMVSDFAGRRLDLAGAECLASNGHLHAAMISVLQQGRRP
ncbi:inositol monophosphatase family protein [Desulfuromonas carbonis]|uniref:inositol monophosphatase family protein n=1 Tax=Desulfuromonas sp. DDH964 TaxID=1823759 RepID=UPI00078B269D|nr:inositol monophosphatase family protein [Desulfuromonas sp. DDH964]AMV71717.1 histidinol-phosphate phosphatase [Desulfuromonas sp. DDH964]